MGCHAREIAQPQHEKANDTLYIGTERSPSGMQCTVF